MTREGSERSEETSTVRAGSEATREEREAAERSEAASSKSSGEGTEPRGSEAAPNQPAPEKQNGDAAPSRKRNGDAAPSRKRNGDHPADMLTIAGHEERQRNGPSDPDEFYGEGDLDEVLPDDDESAGNGSAADDGDLDAVLPDDDAVADTDDDEVEPVELLVQLAEADEIEPWDIDIVRVTDRFLDALESVDLRTSGRALFYASVLLRMKGDELIHGSDEDAEAEPEPWEQPFADDADAPPADPEFDPVVGLEAEMERRLERKQARGTPETLDELVRDLREAERGSWWKEQREYDTSDSPHGFRRGTQTLDYHAGDDRRVDDEPTEEDVTGTTHEEDIEEVIDDVRVALREQYDAGRPEVLFVEVADSGGSRVMTYLALLFLAHRGQVRLQQDELFGDLWVQDPGAPSVSDEAVAD